MITDAMGKTCIHKSNMNVQDLEINCETLVNGMYYLVISGKGYTITSKLLVQHQ